MSIFPRISAIARVALRPAAMLLLCASAAANAEIYKCLRDGQVIYQEAPCNGSGRVMDIPLTGPHQDAPEAQARPAEPARVEEADTRGSLSNEEVERIADVLLEREREDSLYDAAPQEQAAIASCRGIRIYDFIPYDTGGGVIVRRLPPYPRHHPYDYGYGYGYRRREFITTARVQCARLLVKLPGYYGDIFDAMGEEFANRFIATFADDTLARGETAELPDGRVNTASKYSIDVCFGAGDIPITFVGCE